MFSRLSGLLITGGIFYWASRTAADPLPLTVYMTRECECCGNWVRYMNTSGFVITARYLPAQELSELKDSYGVPPEARSCHVAEVSGYVVEGHTPADVVRRLLHDRPAVVGVAVPGMPIGSPGMEMPGQRRQAYNVVAFDRQGTLTLVERR